MMLAAYLGLGSDGTLALPAAAWPVLAALAAFHGVCWRVAPERAAARIPAVPFAVGYGIAWALALRWVPLEARPFIYFQF